METLIGKSAKKVNASKDKMKRSIYADINWNEPLIMLLGYRVVGKTTLLLQRLNEIGNKRIYCSLVTVYTKYQ
jgi:uncharacterized protein